MFHNMKKFSLLLLLLVVAMLTQAQVATNIYWVQFADKNDSPYSIDAPENYLSQRALDRRARQGIAIDEYDLPVNPAYLEAVAGCGAELLNPSKWLNGVSVYTTDPAVVEAINTLPFVVMVRNCPNDLKAQELKEQWLANEMKAVESSYRAPRGFYGEAEMQATQLKVNVLHDAGYQGEGMIIAVLDGGFVGADTHPAFDNMREEGRFLGARSFHRGHPSVYTQSSHGTSCLSTMAGYVPNVYVGTAPKASYFLMHTENGNYENIIEEYNWVSGAELADSLGADVCSTSLGYIDFDMSQWNHPFEHFDGQTAPMSIGAEIAASRGMVCLNAAGNEGDSWSGECTLGIPADAEHILTVGAVDAYGQRAWFSSVGPTYDGRIKPDVMAMGQDTYVAASDGSYYHGSGTSYATPVLAGAVTCLLQSRPLSTVNEFCDAVRLCSDHALSPDNRYGYGIPNLEAAMGLLHVNDSFVLQDELIRVYPNPSNGQVYISLMEGYQTEIKVYDAMGRQLKSYHFNGLNHSTLEHYLNGLTEGVYFINAVTDSYSQTVKLIITK